MDEIKPDHLSRWKETTRSYLLADRECPGRTAVSELRVLRPPADRRQSDILPHEANRLFSAYLQLVCPAVARRAIACAPDAYSSAT